MTSPTGSRDDRFDRAVRRAHRHALDSVPAGTLSRLRPRPAATPSARRPARLPGWALASACAAVFAAVLGAQALYFPSPSPDAPPRVATAQDAVVPTLDDPLVALEEDPDMFLWLASVEAQPLAME